MLPEFPDVFILFLTGSFENWFYTLFWKCFKAASWFTTNICQDHRPTKTFYRALKMKHCRYNQRVDWNIKWNPLYSLLMQASVHSIGLSQTKSYLWNSADGKRSPGRTNLRSLKLKCKPSEQFYIRQFTIFWEDTLYHAGFFFYKYCNHIRLNANHSPAKCSMSMVGVVRGYLVYFKE